MITINIARVRSALKSVGNIEVVVLKTKASGNSNHNLKYRGKNSVSIQGVVVMALNLETSINADVDFMVGGLLELVEYQLKCDNGRKDSGIEIGRASCRERV